MTSAAAWANNHALHPWFKMPSLKRKDLSSDEEDATTTPVRAASYGPRRSLSPAPAPSPKRRRCDVLESGMSQLTLDGRPIPQSPAHFAPGQLPIPPPYNAAGAPAGFPTPPTIHVPDTPAAAQPAPPLWADVNAGAGAYPHAPNVTAIPPNLAPPPSAAVVLPGSVEEPTSPVAAAGAELEPDAPEVAMRVPSWYEIEKDRIVITDLEDSDQEEQEADGPRFTISSALLDRLPKPHALGALAPEANPTNALVLYRPIGPPAPSREEEEEEEDARTPEDTPRIEELEDVPIAEDTEMPVDERIEFTPIVNAVGEPADEPMDIEML
ncbi:hypothetical protein BD413DRAFT_604907 [Trametes elegans]|nr:hypothetical protein BD413DRAFT_604907 [Trametes elegans]